MNTVSGLMGCGIMTPTPKKGLRILLEAKIVSELWVKAGNILNIPRMNPQVILPY
jgi:hypothetical protein